MTKIREFIKNYGIDLHESGINSFAFNVNDTIKLLNLLKEYENILVYGGDILKYEKEENMYRHTYDNWSYNDKNHLDSINLALDKVRFFSNINESEIFVNLVCNIHFYKIIQEEKELNPNPSKI